MSKYIKLEDAIHNINLEVVGRKEYTGDMKANLFFSLDDLPTIEVSEDCISREWLEEHKEVMSYTNGWRETEVGEFVSWENIEDAPSVVPSRAEGEWILECDAEGEGDNLYRCSDCGQNCGCQEYDIPNYCGNCGAKMKGADDETI